MKAVQNIVGGVVSFLSFYKDEGTLIGSVSIEAVMRMGEMVRDIMAGNSNDTRCASQSTGYGTVEVIQIHHERFLVRCFSHPKEVPLKASFSIEVSREGILKMLMLLDSVQLGARMCTLHGDGRYDVVPESAFTFHAIDADPDWDKAA